MARLSFRQWYKRLLRRQLYHPGPLSSLPALVFAPHQDDETLGCGGIIIQKRRAGVPVWIAFLTDGSRSHKALMNRDEIKALRMNEACGAGRVMGVPEDHIRFLQFPNGELYQFRAEAQHKVAALLFESQVEEVYFPSAWDFHSEHRVTAEIVLAALSQLKQDGSLAKLPQAYEYPVWFWDQWPWVSLPADNPKERSNLIRRTLRYGLGLAFLTQFRSAVLIRDVLDTKRAALDQHISQMTRLGTDPNWPTLADVAGGEFLDCFFQECEIFRPIKY